MWAPANVDVGVGDDLSLLMLQTRLRRAQVVLYDTYCEWVLLAPIDVTPMIGAANLNGSWVAPGHGDPHARWSPVNLL